MTTKTMVKQEHNQDDEQRSLFEQERAVARRHDRATSKAAAASVKNIGASHRWVLRLFTIHGPMSDAQAWEAHSVAVRQDGKWGMVPRMSESGLRSRRAELTAPRGKGIRDSGRTVKTVSNRDAVVWEIDP